ncbi:MAG TPA: 1-deoxy-D-xylulose-5-phosphate synthase [Clostridiaceae bacterium]
MYEILDRFEDFGEIKKMTLVELDLFAKEIRDFLIEKVSKTGGHLASNLGVVELTLSLYNVLDLNHDKIIWDVGHQAYVHKIITGRKNQFDSLRSYGGLSGFPKREESKYDFFETGHSSTSISAALGMARARDINKDDYEVVAVIGDGSLTGGMSFEALNDAGYRKDKLIVILNDNQMSIAKNVGGLSSYLSKIRVDPKYNKFKAGFDYTLNKIPVIGKDLINSVEKMKGAIKQIIVPGMIFEDMGFIYLGPIDGHNIKELSKVLSQAKKIDGPVFIHVITKKGKGYNFAEKSPNKFHGIGPFNSANGELRSPQIVTYSSVFGRAMVELGKENDKLIGITAAMTDGTGLSEFSKAFKDRFFDVGIAEQHGVTMAAGMASQGLRPVFAVYSTFLQRAYDQILHDVCIQKLPVVFAIDRAGIVGEDGETHQGVFDLSYLNHIPNLTIVAPKCTDDLKSLLTWSIKQNFPVAIRYPRGGDQSNISLNPMDNIQLGKWEIIVEEGTLVIFAVGKMVQHAMLAQSKLKTLGINVSVVNGCFIKPLDVNMIDYFSNKCTNIITVEDNVLSGGFGSAVLNYINIKGHKVKVTNLGFKDEFITHGDVNILYKLYGLDKNGIVESILKLI